MTTATFTATAKQPEAVMFEGRTTRNARKAAFAALAAVGAFIPALAGPASATAAAPSAANTPVASDGSHAPTGGALAMAGASSHGRSSVAGSGVSTTAAVKVDLAGARSLDGTTPGGVSPKSVIGGDERYLVTDTTGSFTAKTSALILFTIGTKTYMCSGNLIGPDTVATAGHCVAKGGSNSFYQTSTYRIYPAYNGYTGVAPYGSCTARSINSVYGWTRDNNANYDYGAIKLTCTVGYTTGWMGWWWQSADMTGNFVGLNGYPSDHYPRQYTSFGYVRITQPQQLYYDNDTIGMFGAGLWQYRSSAQPYCNGFCLMGVHAFNADSTGYNHGVRITQEVHNNFVYWNSI